MNQLRVVILCMVAGFIMACGQTKPQRPTFRGEQPHADSTSLQLIAMHQTMAEQADLQLARIADKDYVLMEENFWVKGLKDGNPEQPLLQEGDYVDLSVAFYDMHDRMLANHQANVLLGQVDEIQAVVQVLPYLKRNMHVSMLVPWYLAFGSAGNREIPPYENLKVEVNIQ